MVEVPYETIATFGGAQIHNLLKWRWACKSMPNFTVLSVVATIGIEVICAVKFNTVQFKFSDGLVKLTTNSVTSVKN